METGAEHSSYRSEATRRMQEEQEKAAVNKVSDTYTVNTRESIDPSLLDIQERQLEQHLDVIEGIRRNIRFLKNNRGANYTARELRALGMIHF